MRLELAQRGEGVVGREVDAHRQPKDGSLVSLILVFSWDCGEGVTAIRDFLFDLFC